MSHTIVIFGASGDLTSRKLIPALYLLSKKDRLPTGLRVVGVSRTQFSHDAWRDQLAETTAEFVKDQFDQESWQAFAKNIFYQAGNIKQSEDYEALATFLDELENGEPTQRVYYLSTSPKLYPAAVAELGNAGLADESHGERRIVVEKPFGTDLETAQSLNSSLHNVFAERQIYRIDHYLGKETVQNMLVLRFANSIFEPIWNRNFIDHVQITVAEEVTVGRRSGYYDGSGVLRDMFQNHLLQLMTITAMEAPSEFHADLVRDEKVKVLRAVRQLAGADFARDTQRGQYDGYLAEEGVPAGSQTATFAIIKLHVDNWRWQGVPFYLRSGKAMSCRTTQIVIQFREPPLTLFGDKARKYMDANRLVIQVQPAEGIQLHFQTKVPDAEMRVRMTDLDFSFREEFSGSLPDAYQRLLLDAVKGDASLFARSDEVELAWGIIDPIIAAWQSPAAPELKVYQPDLWGQPTTHNGCLIRVDNGFDVCPILE